MRGQASISWQQYTEEILHSMPLVVQQPLPLTEVSSSGLTALQMSATSFSKGVCSLQALVEAGASGDAVHAPVISALGGSLSYLRTLLLDRYVHVPDHRYCAQGLLMDLLRCWSSALVSHEHTDRILCWHMVLST